MELTGPWWDLLPGSPSYLRWPWLALLLAGPLVGCVVWWLRRSGPAPRPLPVSHTDRLRTLPRYRSLVRRRRGWVVLRTLGAWLAALGCLLLVARPADVDTLVDRPSRDVVVCLDVSPSMLKIDAVVVRAVREVVTSLPGDRVGLTVFNSHAVVKFPLTEDFRFVEKAFDELEQAVEHKPRPYVRAAESYPRTSQLGDGLHACVHGFDRIEEHRGRVVLAVSDNQPFGPPVHALEDVGRLAAERDVVVHALAAPSLKRRPSKEAEFRRAAEITGGTLALLDEPTAVPQVIERIDALEQRRLETPPRRSLQDRPQAGLALVTAGTMLLSLYWLRRTP